LSAAASSAQEGPANTASLPPSASSTPRTTDALRFVSPLRTYTVFDPDPASSSSSDAAINAPRRKFFPRFRAGLAAERREREAIKDELQAELLSEAEGGDNSEGYGREWAAMEEAKDEVRRGAEEARVERAHDRAVAAYDRRSTGRAAIASLTPSGARAKADGKDLQFVGVINPGRVADKKVTWYARPKPATSKWSVRLVHVNRDAVLRDMFTAGKIDVFGSYINSGKKVLDRDGEPTLQPALEGKYTVRSRNWRNAWNFNPLHFFSDSSGMYWRERRLTPGIYTDGRAVYESAYRYRDGKNGMKPVGTLDGYLRSGNADKERVEEIKRRLREDGPDVVVED